MKEFYHITLYTNAMKVFCQDNNDQCKDLAYNQGLEMVLSCDNGKSYGNTSHAIRSPKSSAFGICKALSINKTTTLYLSVKINWWNVDQDCWHDLLIVFSLNLPTLFDLGEVICWKELSYQIKSIKKRQHSFRILKSFFRPTLIRVWIR